MKKTMALCDVTDELYLYIIPLNNRWMLSFNSILNESGKSSIEALHCCKMILKSFKNPKIKIV